MATIPIFVISWTEVEYNRVSVGNAGLRVKTRECHLGLCRIEMPSGQPILQPDSQGVQRIGVIVGA